MAGLQQTVTKAAAHLREMTLSQRVAILLGLVLVVGSLAWMVQWAASPEMVPLLNQRLSPEDLARISAGLDILNQPYRSDGSMVYVPAAADRASLLGRLQQSDQMPADTSIGFAELVREANPWISQAESNRRWTLALQSELERVLSSFSGVERASVFLNPGTERRGFSRQPPEASASVTLTMRGGAPAPRELALSAARLVSGAVPGLPLHNVQVLDSRGRAAIDWESEQDGSGSALARRQKQYEQDVARKIVRQLDYIPDVKVSVQVVLNRTASTIDAADVTEGTKLQETSFEEESARARRAQQPGVQPNVGVAAGGGESGDRQTRSETSRTYQPSIQKTIQTTPAGGVDQVFAAISVSHQFLEAVFQRSHGDAKPTEEQLEAVFQKHKDRIAEQVSKLVYPPDPEQIAMSWHYSPAAGAPAPAEAGSAVGVGALEMAGRYAPAAGLGALALVALVLVLRMARQSHAGESFGIEIGLPQEALEAAKRARRDLERVERGKRSAAEQARAEVAAAIPMGIPTDGLLEGQEVPEDVAEVTKMLAQVAEHVKKDDQAVAALVERWVED